MLTRRDTLKLGFTSYLSASLIGCSNQLPGCPVSWVPSLLAPVFYGYKDYNACANLADCEVNHPVALSDVTLPANPNTAVRVLPPQSSQQQFYAGSFLSGLSVCKQWNFPAEVPCLESVFWQTASSTGSTYLISS